MAEKAGDNYLKTEKDRLANARDAQEITAAKKAGAAAESASAREKFQGFTAGGPAKSDPDEPKRSDFPSGLVGQASYTKALSDYRSRSRKQADALGKAMN